MSAPNFIRIGTIGVKQQVKINDTVTVTTLNPLPSYLQLAEIFASAIGFSFKVIATADGSGKLLKNGTRTGLLGMLEKNEVDMVLGPIALTNERIEVFLFSYPYGYSEINFATRKPAYEPDMAAFIHPLSTGMWIAITVSLCAMSIFLRVLLQKKHIVVNLFMSTVSSLLKQGMKYRPRKIREHFLLAFWFLGATFVGHIYSAVLLSFLTFPSLIGIKTIEDLASGIRAGKYETSTFPGTYYSSFMLQSNDESFKTIGSRSN